MLTKEVCIQKNKENGRFTKITVNQKTRTIQAKLNAGFYSVIYLSQLRVVQEGNFLKRLRFAFQNLKIFKIIL